MVYLISYDLHRPGQQYPELWAALDNIGAFPVLLSQRACDRSGTSSKAIADYLMPHIDRTDRLLVCAMGEGTQFNLINPL